jgi:hypothetical protein
MGHALTYAEVGGWSAGASLEPQVRREDHATSSRRPTTNL